MKVFDTEYTKRGLPRKVIYVRGVGEKAKEAKRQALIDFRADLKAEQAKEVVITPFKRTCTKEYSSLSYQQRYNLLLKMEMKDAEAQGYDFEKLEPAVRTFGLERVKIEHFDYCTQPVSKQYTEKAKPVKKTERKPTVRQHLGNHPLRPKWVDDLLKLFKSNPQDLAVVQRIVKPYTR